MNKIKIGLPSKGRLKDESIKLFSSKGLNIQNTNSRNYFFNFDEDPNYDGIFLHAREIIERINDGTLDTGISGLDLLMELPMISVTVLPPIILLPSIFFKSSSLL